MVEWYEASSARKTSRNRWDQGRTESRPTRMRDLEDVQRRAAQALGPYETRYEVTRGYGRDREILTP